MEHEHISSFNTNFTSDTSTDFFKCQNKKNLSCLHHLELTMKFQVVFQDEKITRTNDIDERKPPHRETAGASSTPLVGR